MIMLTTFKDIARNINRINRESWLVKVHVVVTGKHIILKDTDNEIEFFRKSVENINGFNQQLYVLYQSMLNFDYSGLGKIRPNLNKRYSNKLYELWKQANEKKSSKLLLTQ